MPSRSRRPAERPPAQPVLDAAELTPVSDWAPDDESVHRNLRIAGMGPAGATLADVEVDHCQLIGLPWDGRRFTRLALTDCVIDHCAMANIAASKSSLVRVAVIGSKLTGLSWVEGTLRDVVFQDCKIDLASFRFERLTNVVFNTCNLTGCDFQQSDLRGVRFEQCTLAGARFANANLAGARFLRCDMDGIGGVDSFAGAIIGAADLLSLSRPMAASIGIVVRDDE